MIKNNIWQKMFQPDEDPKKIPSINNKLKRYAEGIDYHLSMLKYVLSDLHDMRNELLDLLNLQSVVNKYESYNIPYNVEFERLKELMKICPNSINHREIYKDTPTEKINKANAIIDIFLGSVFLDGLNFLNYGCEDGILNYCALKENPKTNIGYNESIKHEVEDGFITTNNWSQVQKNGPYDIILLFDILDHSENIDSILQQIKEVLDINGKIFIRCHPWCSRHGTHLYESGLNKAYAHLIFDDVELVRLGNYVNKKTIKITEPLKTYKNWFISNGFNIIKETPTYSNIEHFFYRPEIINRIKKHWQREDYFIIPEEDMMLEFVDYEIEHIKGIL